MKFKIIFVLKAVYILFFLYLQSIYSSNYYLDPQLGSMSNDGSAEHPWSTLSEVLSQKIIADGDTLFLRSGFHGYNFAINGTHNSPTVIMAEAGQTPVLLKININGANWVLDGITFTPEGNRGHEIRNGNDNGRLLVLTTTSSNNMVKNCEIYSAANTNSWSVQNWRDSVWSGIFDYGTNNLIVNNKLKNVAYALTALEQSNHSTFKKNIVEIFSGDGIRCAGAKNLTVEQNIIRNAVELDPDPYVNNHEDGIQGWGDNVGLTIQGNYVYSNTAIDTIPLIAPIQGIVIFDGSTTDAIIENNVIVTEHWHGITILGAYNTKIINNTVLPVPNITATQGPPWIRIDKKKDGTSSSGNIVRNNLATALVIENGSSIVDHNVINQSAELFCNDYDNWDFTPKQDFVLGGLAIIDAGSSVDAPNIDIDGNLRPQGNAYDIGAYESPYSFEQLSDDFLTTFSEDFNSEVDTAFWANNWAAGKILADRDSNTFKYETDSLNNYFLGVVLDFKNAKSKYVNLTNYPYITFQAKVNGEAKIAGVAVDSIPIGLDLINPSGNNIGGVYKKVMIAADGKWHKCKYDFTNTSGIDSVAKVRFNPGKERFDGFVFYSGSVSIDNFKLGKAAANIKPPADLTTFTEDFNNPINTNLWRPNEGTLDDGTPIFTLTQENNALKYEMVQKEFSDGQYFDFFKYDSLRFNLTDNPFFSIDIKVDSGATYGGTETSTVSFLASPWGYSPVGASGNDTLVRQVKSPSFDVPADSKWHIYKYDFGAEIGEALWDGTIPPGDFTNIEGILFETAKWPESYTAVFYIDNFKLGDAAAQGGQLSEPIVSKKIPVQTGKFTATWKVTPTHSPMDGVTGLAKGEVGTFSDMGVIVRMNSSGKVDARNGGAYEALNELNYETNKEYTIKVIVDVPAQKYSVIVTPAGGDSVVIGTDYAFRTDTPQESLGYMAMVINELQQWGGVPGSRLNPSFLNDDYTIITGVEKLNNELPTKFAIEQNYPNPFNPTTTIQYTIPKVKTLHVASQQTTYQHVQIKIYDILGNEITTLVNKNQKPGLYQISFNAKNLSSGVYIYVLKAGNFVQAKKMILLQ